MVQSLGAGPPHRVNFILREILTSMCLLGPTSILCRIHWFDQSSLCSDWMNSAPVQGEYVILFDTVGDTEQTDEMLSSLSICSQGGIEQGDREVTALHFQQLEGVLEKRWCRISLTRSSKESGEMPWCWKESESQSDWRLTSQRCFVLLQWCMVT